MVTVVTDADKLGTVAPFVVAAADIDQIVTTGDASRRVLTALRKQGVQIIVPANA